MKNHAHTRLTKIVVTMGPALDHDDALRDVLRAGASVFRANFSHGIAEDHEKRIQKARQFAAELGHEIAILADLQGPKIRIARFKNKKIELKDGQDFTIDIDMDPQAGTTEAVGSDYLALPQDVCMGDTLLLDDGKIVLSVKDIIGNKVYCTVVVGGELSDNKGINRKGGGLSAPALTDKDRQDLKTAIRLGADYIAVSFPRSAADIFEARILIKAAKGHAKIIAKIERAEAIPVIDEIIRASDAVMVARGDLAVEIGDAEVPAVQKHIIRRSRALNKPVITATQMLESMIYSPVPTRAEVSDIANAVLDHTDAIMLSAETASGKYPAKAVEAMARAASAVEKHPEAYTITSEPEPVFKAVDEAIAMAAMYTANHLNIKAIIALTESGNTPLWMSRIRSGIPIYALSRSVATQRAMTLYRGVHPIAFDPTQFEGRELNKQVVACLQERGLVTQGDLVLITKGDQAGVHGKTNTMKIYEVGFIKEGD